MTGLFQVWTCTRRVRLRGHHDPREPQYHRESKEPVVSLRTNSTHRTHGIRPQTLDDVMSDVVRDRWPGACLNDFPFFQPLMMRKNKLYRRKNEDRALLEIFRKCHRTNRYLSTESIHVHHKHHYISTFLVSTANAKRLALMGVQL